MARRVTGITVVVAALGAAAWFVLRPGDVQSVPSPNVVLVLVDTLRADHVRCYGYERETSPVIDAFARDHLKFNWAIATAP